MILEKIKDNIGKIIFFAANVSLVAIGFLFFWQKNLEHAIEETNALAKESADRLLKNADDMEALIADDRQQKIDSIANNPAIVTKQETVQVTKTIPGATRTVTVPSGTTSSKTTSTTKKTASAPAPAKSTKTS